MKTVCLFVLMLFFNRAFCAELAITMDDPSIEISMTDPLSNLLKEKNQRILNALKKHHAQAILFVCGKRIDSEAGKLLLSTWSLNGHWLGNHTYSHDSYNSKIQTFESFSSDFIRGENVIKTISGFHKIFRFPFLKEGNTAEKRDQMRNFLTKQQYSQGMSLLMHPIGILASDLKSG